MPRVPLPEASVTRFRVVSPTTSKGATPSSSLLRTHAPDLPPLEPSAFALGASLCRMLRGPAGRRSFPALSPQIFPQMLGPLPRRFSWCTCPLLPRRPRPLPTWERLGNTHTCRTATSVRGSFSGLQTFAHVQASGFARHPGRSYRSGSFVPPGSRGFYVRAHDGLLPPRPSDMLDVHFVNPTPVYFGVDNV